MLKIDKAGTRADYAGMRVDYTDMVGKMGK
jgi:hypothetical protein